MHAITLRPATLEDAELLLVWRNDPLTRRASHHGDEILPSAHLAWLVAALSNPLRQIFIAESAGQALGSLRVDRDPEGVSELSWTVAPAARGRGIGKGMLLALLERLSGPVCAEVRQGNIASMRIAEAAGLSLVREEAGVLYYAGVV